MHHPPSTRKQQEQADRRLLPRRYSHDATRPERAHHYCCERPTVCAIHTCHAAASRMSCSAREPVALRALLRVSCPGPWLLLGSQARSPSRVKPTAPQPRGARRASSDRVTPVRRTWHARSVTLGTTHMDACTLALGARSPPKRGDAAGALTAAATRRTAFAKNTTRSHVCRHTQTQHCVLYTPSAPPQCILYDSDAPDARLIGLEYIISARLFEVSCRRRRCLGFCLPSA
jgi:hypothetical protein